MDISVVILAAGKGTRLGGVCKKTPKPMLKFNGHPFLSYQANHFLRLGCSEVIIVSGHLSESISDYFDTEEWISRGVKVVKDTRVIGTAYSATVGIKSASNKTIFQCNGDTVAEFDFKNMYSQYVNLNLPAMALLTLQTGVQNQGAALVENGTVTEFIEGREPQEVFLKRNRFRGSSTGCYFINKDKALKVYAGASSFEREVLPKLVEQKLLAGAHIQNGELIDFGTPERLGNLRKNVNILSDVYEGLE